MKTIEIKHYDPEHSWKSSIFIDDYRVDNYIAVPNERNVEELKKIAQTEDDIPKILQKFEDERYEIAAKITGDCVYASGHKCDYCRSCNETPEEINEITEYNQMMQDQWDDYYDSIAPGPGELW